MRHSQHEHLPCGAACAPDPCVCVEPGALNAAFRAAGELGKYWKLVTGRDLPAHSPCKIIIGADASLDAALDEYRIVSVANGVSISGANGRAILYAAYDLLERRAGCRWFWDGDVVPHLDAIDLSGLDVREKSRFEYRAIRYFAHRGLTRFQAEHWGRAEWEREIDWCVKRRLNCIMLRIGMDDTWQKAFPDLVKYPDPAAPDDEGMRGHDNRALFWDLRHRGELRAHLTRYAIERGLLVPTDFGTLTHWYARTPREFLEAKSPAFLPQANRNYNYRSGLVWDVREGEWADDYLRLTEAAVEAGYGQPSLLHTIGLGERMCYDDRPRNLALKREVLSIMTRKALERYPDAKILLAGWDFYSTWRPEEVRELVSTLDPERVIVWDYEGEACHETDGNDDSRPNDFTQWGLVGRFPYTFGIFLAYENALDIRAHYGAIERREKTAAADPFCKGYILWPESSHTDTFLLRYFTANAWRPGQGHGELLPVFCRDRYGEKAAPVFESLWRRVIPISELLGWWDNWGCELLSWLGEYCQGHGLEEDGRILAAAPGIFRDLAALEPEGEFQWRDVIDLARTVSDRMAIWIHQRLFKAFFEWCDGTGGDCDVRDWIARYLSVCDVCTEILALHTDYSLCESLDRLRQEAPVPNPDFASVLLDNASCPYCRSHQYEIAAGCYVPFARAFAGEIARRLDAGMRERIPDEWAHETIRRHLESLAAAGIEAYRPSLPRTLSEYRRVMLAGASTFPVPRRRSRPSGSSNRRNKR